MSADNNKETTISEEDYAAIEEAVMETARGRWFLKEYAARNRVTETDKVLSAVESLRSYIVKEGEPADVLQMRLDIVEMAHTIDAVKKEIAATRTQDGDERLNTAQQELDAVVAETENSTSAILEAAEKIQGTAWEMRDEGIDPVKCDALDALATEIYTACSFQDITGQRIKKVFQITQFLEQKLTSLIALWGDREISNIASTEETRSHDKSLLNGPGLPTETIEQNYVDAIMEEVGSPEEAEDDDMLQIAWDDDFVGIDDLSLDDEDIIASHDPEELETDLASAPSDDAISAEMHEENALEELSPVTSSLPVEEEVSIESPDEPITEPLVKRVSTYN